jgi:hypothetical protein
VRVHRTLVGGIAGDEEGRKATMIMRSDELMTC